MTATLIATSSEAEWLEARRQGVTASEIAVLMGLSPYGSAFELYHRKTGTLPGEREKDDAMGLGTYMESYVAGRFSERFDDAYFVHGDGRELYAHPDRRWQMATPDRILHGWGTRWAEECREPDNPLAVLECKIDGGSDEWGDDGTDEIPVHYRCQVLWQMDVMGVTTGYVACLLWQKRKVRVYELHMDADAQSDLKVMRSAARRFLERIDHGDVPDVDWRPATTGALKALHPEVDDGREVLIGRQLAISWRAAVRRCKEAEQRKDEMANRLLAAMGTAQHAVERGTLDTVASRSVSHPRRVSATLLRERHPAIAAECTPDPKPVIKLTPARAKKRKTP